MKEPVIDFRLLANRNFAIASVLFLVFGFGLFGSTTLIPQILQSLYGYRATDAGLVLGPGALVITFFAPIAAQLIQRQIVPARVLLADQHRHRRRCHVVLQYLHSGHGLQPLCSGQSISRARIRILLRACQCACVFAIEARPEQQGLQPHQPLPQLGRQFWDRVHHHRDGTPPSVSPDNSRIGNATTSNQLTDRITALTNYLMTKGFSGPDAAAAAHGYLYQQLQHQVSLLSFMDCFRVIAWLTLAAVPLLFFIRRFKPAGKAPAAH